MKLVGLTYSKISIERKETDFRDTKVNRNLNVTSIASAPSRVDLGDEALIQAKFVYTISYQPDKADLLFEGVVVFAVTKAEAETILSQWEGKKVEPRFQVVLFNTIMKKSDVKAMALEEEMNMPLHVPLPTLRPGKK